MVVPKKRRSRKGNMPGTKPVVEGLEWASAGDIPAIDWLLPGAIPAGSIVVLEGRKGTGKSSLAAAICAAVAGGPRIPGWIGRGAGRILWIAPEEDWHRVASRRLLLAGCGVDQIARPALPLGNGRSRNLILPNDLPWLKNCCQEADIRLLVIDPWIAVLAENLDEYRSRSVRLALEPLAQMLAENQTTAILIRHLTKKTGCHVLDQGEGSGAIGQVARAVLRCDKHPRINGQFVMYTLAVNLGRPLPTLAYTLKEDTSSLFTVQWIGRSDLTVEDAGSGMSDGVELDEWDDADLVLCATIGTDPTPYATIREEGRNAGVNERTLRKARKRLGIETKHVGFGSGSYWSWLPPKDGWPESLTGKLSQNSAGGRDGASMQSMIAGNGKNDGVDAKVPKVRTPNPPRSKPSKKARKEADNGET